MSPRRANGSKLRALALRAVFMLGMLSMFMMAAATSSSPAAAAPLRFDFSVPSLAGGTLSNEDLKGKIVVIDVWATWCGPCRMVIPHLVRLQEKFKASGVVVVGLNADDDAASGPGREDVRAFVKQYGINYPIGLMNANTYIQLGRVMGFNAEEGFSLPTTLLLGRNGLVVKRYPGYFRGQEQELEQLISSLIASEAEPPKKP